jgi:signal transduction histidine kinase/CheY-like chemotaxis protein
MSLEGNYENREDGQLELSQLLRRIEKLTKINAALMQRVEKSMDQQANAYSLFQTAISLESQVRLRTDELKSALDRLEKTNEELITARDAAELANRFKTRFFTAVGHDLLQPLHAARLSLSAMEESEGSNSNLRLAAQVDHALSTIEELLRTILDLSQLEAGVTRPNIQVVPLNDVFRSIIFDMEPIARSKNLSLTWRPTKLNVLSDPLMLRRVLQNLLSNAVRYTDRGGIKLAARHRGKTVHIEVWDTGPGIAPSEQSRIFEEFQRGAAAVRATGTGFGLGLSIVQRSAEALGHQIRLCSKVGIGTRISVVAQHAGTVSAAKSPQSPESARQVYGFSSAHVVVIDNDHAVLEAMKNLLTRWQCDVRYCINLTDIDELIARSSGFVPNLILADYHLDDGVSGLMAVEKLRSAWGEHIPAVIITADHSPMAADMASRQRCELLKKPVRPAELRALMQHLLS